MFADPLIIGIFFKVLNFVIIIACSAYLFKQYGYDTVRQMMDEKEDEFKRLRAQKVDIRRQNKTLDLQLKEQQETCKRLKHNVGIWKEIALQKQEADKQELKIIYNQMARIRSQQADTVILKRLEHQVMPVALKKAQQQLEKQFSSEKQGEEFIKTLLADLQKGTQ